MRYAAIALALLLTACGSKPSATPEPRVVTVDVPKIVREKCKDARPAAPDYPDTNEKLASIADNDYFELSKRFRAGRDLRDARLATDDAQIKGCSGGE